MAIGKVKGRAIEQGAIGADQIATGAITIQDIPDGEITMAKLSQVNLDIAPEVLAIQVDAPQASQDTAWLWTWQQSTLPYARLTITNSPEAQVPLYKQGTYTVDNYAAYDLHDEMTQTHSLYMKWIDGAGTDNLVSWAVNDVNNPIVQTHPDINGGSATQVQRINIAVPTTITPPALTPPSVSYTVSDTVGAYVFSGAAFGSNPNLGPWYRGGTYTININAAGHPFYFTTDNGTNFSNAGYFGEYTNGVTGSRNETGTITITVPQDAPDTLYYQCGYHASMFGAITIKDLAVQTNANGNYVVYFQHTQEGHKTPVELRPIPSLVNQMCLVYDLSSGKFVPQDLATYVENTPSFKRKIQEVAGTSTLVDEAGDPIVASVKIYYDSTYLPLVGNNEGDLAFATDNNTLYVWQGTAWSSTKTADSIIQGLIDATATTLQSNIDLKAPVDNPTITTGATVENNLTVDTPSTDVALAVKYNSTPRLDVSVDGDNSIISTSSGNALKLQLSGTDTMSLINNVNNGGQPGVYLGANALGFDESGVRSWNLRANSGALRVDPGDGGGKMQVNSIVKANGFQMAADGSAGGGFNASKNGYIGDMLSDGVSALFYLGQMQSSSSSNASGNWVNVYTSGHWGEYTKIIIYGIGNYYDVGFGKWFVNGTTVTSIQQYGSVGSVSSSQTQIGSGTHGGQNVYRYNITLSNWGTYTSTKWFMGYIGGGNRGIVSNAHTSSAVDSYMAANGGGVHLLTVNDAGLQGSPHARFSLS